MPHPTETTANYQVTRTGLAVESETLQILWPLPSCCMLRDSKNPVPTGRYGRDGDAVW